MSTIVEKQDNPLFRLVQLASGLWASRALWAAAHLKIADAVGDGPTPVAEIAAATGTRPDRLRRLMRALASIEVFREGEGDTFAHGLLSPMLRSDHPLSQRDFIATIFGGEHYAGWGAIAAGLTGEATPFDTVYGRPVFDWYGDHPAEAQAFSRAMAGTTMLIEAVLLAAWTPPPFTLAVDVGGSRGTLLKALVERHPDSRGILFDLPETADAVRATLGDRIETVGGDFFAQVPEGDLYLLKMILHDWDDEKSAAILSNIRAASRPGGHVAIIDALLPETAGDDAGFLMDINMMVMTGGRERSASDFEALLARTGFRIESVTPTPAAIGVVQAVAV